MNRISVLLVDVQPFFRDGVRSFLQGSPRFHVAGEAGDSSTALHLARTLPVDVVILDIPLPDKDGLGFLRQLRAERISSRVLFLTLQRDQGCVDEAINLGASGYLLKNDPREYLTDAILAAMRGEKWLSPKLTQALLRRRSTNQKLSANQPNLSRLSPTERRVAALVAENLTSRQIAARLGTSALTVGTHRRNAARKLGISGAHGFLQFALRHRSELNET
jgi:DNA-binding NarL/FixJ family response regulator